MTNSNKGLYFYNSIAQLGKQANTSFLQEAQVVEIQRLKAELGDGYKYLAQLYMEPLRFKRTAEKEKSAKDAEMGMEDMVGISVGLSEF